MAKTMAHGAPGADPAAMRPDNRSVLPVQCDHDPTHAYCSRCCPCWECWDIRDADGMARLQHDVVTLPPDQQALGLVEAILDGTHTLLRQDTIALRARLAIIQGNAERLKVLLEKGDEGEAALRDLLSGQAVDIAKRETAVRELRAENAALLEALDDCQKHIVALTSLGPGNIDIDAARASASAARALCAKIEAAS